MNSTTCAPWVGAPWTPRAWQASALPVIIDALKRRQRGIVSAVMGAGKSIIQSEIVAQALPKLGHRTIVVTVPRQALVRQLAATIGARVGKSLVGVYYGNKKQPGRAVVVCCNASLPALWRELQSYPRPVALMICDEAHGTQGEVLRATIPEIKPSALVGFTATPFRSVPSETIEVFDSVIYRYTMTDAMADGVLVPMRHERVRGEASGSIDDICLAMMQEHGEGPGIVSATSIEDADAYAEWLTARDFRAASIHSKHTEKERIELLAGLRAGEYRALVHVSLLAEGVDFPWLRWLCLRRNVQARVRFLQEIGRVLRVDNDPDPRFGPKREGVVLDPHLLLGRHGLVTVEAIGAALEEAAEEEAKEGRKVGGEREPTEPEAVALDVLRAYLADVRAGLERAGILEASIARGGWALADVSLKQVEAIKGASKLTRHVPEEHRKAIKTLVGIPYALTRGDAADLLDVLYGGARWARPQIDTGRGIYPNQVQWDAGAVRVDAPDHEALLAAGRGGRKSAPPAQEMLQQVEAAPDDIAAGSRPCKREEGPRPFYVGAVRCRVMRLNDDFPGWFFWNLSERSPVGGGKAKEKTVASGWFTLDGARRCAKLQPGALRLRASESKKVRGNMVRLVKTGRKRGDGEFYFRVAQTTDGKDVGLWSGWATEAEARAKAAELGWVDINAMRADQSIKRRPTKVRAVRGRAGKTGTAHEGESYYRMTQLRDGSNVTFWTGWATEEEAEAKRLELEIEP